MVIKEALELNNLLVRIGDSTALIELSAKREGGERKAKLIIPGYLYIVFPWDKPK